VTEVRRVLIAGCGYVGEALARRLVERGDEVFGLRRDPSTLDPRIRGLAADVTSPGSLAGLPRVDAVVYAVSAGGRHEGAYRGAYVEGVKNVCDALERGPGLPDRTIFVSSTAVYAQDDDSWVDESSEAAPTRATAKLLLEAESAMGRAPDAKILRLSGIYGPGRHHLIRTVDEGQRLEHDPFSNRIHRDDAAAALEILLETDDARDLFIGTDDVPARLSEVRAYIAELLAGERPDWTRRDDGETVSTAAGRGGSKRLSNARLRSLGFVPAFPSYRDGYPAIVRGYVERLG
jgi:nucleoside-diphosphate-sugar epimerase